MLNKVLLVVFTTILATTSHGLVAQEPKEREKGNGWSDFGKGSWIFMQQNLKIGEETKTGREKAMIIGFEADQVNVAKLPEVDGKFVDEKRTSLMSHRFTFNANGFDEGKRRRETIEIAGKNLECTVHEFTRIGKDPVYTAKITIWRASTVKIPYREILQDINLALPADAVKVRFAFEDDQQRSKKYTGSVEDFTAKLKTGTRELTCVSEKWLLEEVDPKTGKSMLEARIWLSAEVPGCEVKLVVNGNYRGKAVVMERAVVDFHAVKRQP